MKRVVTAVILIPIVVIALFRAPLWLFALLVLGVSLLAAGEYLNIAEANGLSPFRRLCYLFVISRIIPGHVLARRDDRQQLQLGPPR